MTHGNEPAFIELKRPLLHDGHSTGLTKREYFAAMALNGILSDPNITWGELTAEASVQAADHLIAALNKLQTEGGDK